MGRISKPSQEPESKHVVKYREHVMRAVEELMQRLNDTNRNHGYVLEGNVITLRRVMLKPEDVPQGHDNFVVTAHMKVTMHLHSTSVNCPPTDNDPEPAETPYDPTSRH